jgi:hypothetical protein
MQEVLPCRLGSLFLERQMHPLMPAVLFGMSRLDALDGNTQTQPPDGQFAQAEEGAAAGERDTVVHSEQYPAIVDRSILRLLPPRECTRGRIDLELVEDGAA